MPLGTCQGDIILIVKFNKEIGRLRILNKAQSLKCSKQVVFDTVKILQLQKSVISIGSDCFMTGSYVYDYWHFSSIINHDITISDLRRVVYVVS